jgi:ATP-binding cassette, subfamily B, bacterial
MHGMMGMGMGWDQQKPKRPLTRETLLRILAFFKPYAVYAWGVLLTVVVMAALGVLPAYIVRAIFDNALNPAHPDGDLLNWLVIAFVAAPVISGLIGVWQNYLGVMMGQKVMYDLRNTLYSHLQRLSLRFFTSTRTGEVISRVVNDVNGVQDVVTGTFTSIVSNVLTLVVTAVAMFTIDWRLSLLSLCTLPLLIYPTLLVGRARYRISKDTQAKFASMSQILQETLSISGIVLVKSFMRQNFEVARFSKENADLMRLQIRGRMVGRWFFMLIGLFTAVAPALVYWFGGHEVIAGRMSIGDILAFTALVARLFLPVTTLLNVNTDVQSSLALFDRIFEYLDEKPEIVERPNPITPPQSAQRVEFSHVGFSYADGNRAALDDINFTMEPGTVTALVGPSGAGKTTITYLLPRLYDATEGQVCIDDYDVRDLCFEWLGEQIGIVTQETFLFNATVRENLRYGKPDATDEELIAAAQQAQIHGLIASMPNGYNTIVGERGYKLSGGEKQRIAIARVILKNPRILILDEATSALDSHSEAAVQAALANLMQGRTSLVIAHRLSTILSADQILFVQEGRIAERGSHAQLLTAEGLYSQLYERQFRNAQGEFAALPGSNGSNGHTPTLAEVAQKKVIAKE